MNGELLFEAGYEGEAAAAPQQPVVDAPPRPPRDAQEQTRFHGVLTASGGALYLESGGIRVRVEGDLPASAAGPSVTLLGVQEDGVIRNARLAGNASGRIEAAGAQELRRAAEVLERNRGLFERANVVSVRPGYKFRNGRITREPAIVVSVARKRDLSLLERDERLPESVDGIPVDVTPASPEEIIARRGETEAVRFPTSAAEDALLIDDLTTAEAEEAPRPQPVITYEPPPHVRLDEVTGAMRVTCTVSPDAGSTVLVSLLRRASESLDVAMYDFTAPHILAAVKAALRGSDATMRMVLGPHESLPTEREIENDPDMPKANDLPEEKILRSLRRALGQRFEVQAASVGEGRIFAQAYHIKVAVADRKAFWLSSGNWQTSNQPAIDFLDPESDTREMRKYNREWHVVVDNAALSRMWSEFIEWDFDQAGAEQAERESAEVEPQLFLPEAFLEEALEAAALRVFPPATFTFTSANPLRVQPLLTPDNYMDHVLRLVRSARQKLYFQNQSLDPIKSPSEEFVELLELLRDKSNDPDLDTRIIIRDIGDIRKKLESLQLMGFDMSKVRVQRGCHTKGIVVDSKTVLVGSHNWTNKGTQYNRDASLIFHDRGIAGYYEDVFLHDWERWSRPSIREELMPLVAEEEEATPAGMIRVSWSQYFD